MKEIARILYGSQNYRLNLPNSDEDYKILLCPEFIDFYNSRKVEKSDVPAWYDHEHNSPMSVIQFHHLLMKGNPNCLEMLFSSEIETSNADFLEYQKQALDLFMCGYLATIWKDFYSAMRGIALNIKLREGITPKSVSRAVYLFGLTQQVMIDNFRMTHGSWRGSHLFVREAIAIRTKESMFPELQLQYDHIVERFEMMRDESLECAQEYLDAGGPELLTYFQAQKEILDERMQKLVANSLKEDLQEIGV